MIYGHSGSPSAPMQVGHSIKPAFAEFQGYGLNRKFTTVVESEFAGAQVYQNSNPKEPNNSDHIPEVEGLGGIHG